MYNSCFLVLTQTMETTTEAFDTTTPAFNTTTVSIVDDSGLSVEYLFAIGIAVFFILTCCSRGRPGNNRNNSNRNSGCHCGDCGCPRGRMLESCRCRECAAVLRSCSVRCVSKCSLICEWFRTCLSDSNNANSDVEVAPSPPVTISRQFSEIVEHRTDNINDNPSTNELPPPLYDSIVSNPSQPPPSYEEVMR